jgi:hypothetical protein
MAYKYETIINKVDNINDALWKLGIKFHLNYGEAYESYCFVGWDDTEGSGPGSSHAGKTISKLCEGTRAQCAKFLDGFWNMLYLPKRFAEIRPDLYKNKFLLTNEVLTCGDGLLADVERLVDNHDLWAHRDLHIDIRFDEVSGEFVAEISPKVT